MKVNFHEFIARGHFGPFRVGAALADVVALLGEPPLFAPERPPWCAQAKYGDLEFLVNSGSVTSISLCVPDDGDDVRLPAPVSLEDADILDLHLSELEFITSSRKVQLVRLDEWCDDWNDQYLTSTSVNLVVRDGWLVKVCAADPKRWADDFTKAQSRRRE